MGSTHELLPGIRTGAGAPLFLISGPCVIENRSHSLQTAARLKDIAAAAGIPLIFKSSYDKANRSSVKSYRGPGLEEGLEIVGYPLSAVGRVVITHGHLDHDGNCFDVVSRSGAELWAHEVYGNLLGIDGTRLSALEEKGVI